MKYILTFLAVLFVLPASALEVTVSNDGGATGDRALVGATIDTLQNKVALLNNMFNTQESIIKATDQVILKMNTCAADENKVYDATKISAANPSGCVPLAMDPNAVADALNCVNGQVIKFIGGKLQCTNQMVQCTLYADEEKESIKNDATLGILGSYLDSDGETVRVPNACIKKEIERSREIISTSINLGTYTDGVWVPTNVQPTADDVTQEGSWFIGTSSDAGILYAVCTAAGMFANTGYIRISYRMENSYRFTNTRLVCN